MSTQANYHLLAKPTGAICNLDCKYCFFLSKEMLYPGSRFRMADDLLERYVDQLIASHGAQEVVLAFQGGEPTLMGLDFFRRAVAHAERRRRPGQKLSYTVQTNGTTLDDAWCAFFAERGFLIGLSLDGPRAMHDAYRVTKGGAGSFDQVMRGLELLARHGVDTNILCTVHAANGDHPLEVYRFFRDELGVRFIQLIPIVERVTDELLPLANLGWSARAGGARPLHLQRGSRVTERSVGPEQYGRFLIAIFDEWVRRDVGTVFVQSFDAALASHVGEPSLCIFRPTCGDAPVLEHSGDVYSCDHFVEPEHLLGNIREKPIGDLLGSEQQRAFGRAKLESLPQYCKDCDFLFACWGECPKNRFATTPDGQPGLNYLCAGYKLFFAHVDRPMKRMASLLRMGRHADEIMQDDAAYEEKSQ